MTHGAPSPYLPSETYEKTQIFRFGSTNIRLPSLKINDDTVIYVLNIMGGDPSHIVNYATDLCFGFDNILSKRNILPVDGFISAEGKAIHLVYEVALQAERPYTILRKSCKLYMGDNVISEKINTPTTIGGQELYLDNKDLRYVSGKRLVFIDDVISSGATLEASQKIVQKAGGEIVGCMAMAIEGNYKPNIPSYFLTYLPIIKIGKNE